MWKRLLGAALTAALCACGSATGGTPPATGPTPDPSAMSGPTPDPATMEQAALADSVRSSYTQADIDFMRGMIHHHAQALVMSRMAPTHGASPSLRIMAERIINAQRDEIALMTRWLQDRGESAPTEAERMGHEHDPAMHMPGMLSPEQMEALDAARGEEFDRLFLTYMIQHHQGAVTMVRELFATRGAARQQTVFKLASDIEADQSSEITRMQSMLQDIVFGDDP